MWVWILCFARHTFRDDANTLGNGLGCDWVITSNHDDFDSSTAAFADGVGDSGSRRVNHGHQANEAEVLEREVHLEFRKSSHMPMVLRTVCVLSEG